MKKIDRWRGPRLRKVSRLLKGFALMTLLGLAALSSSGQTLAPLPNFDSDWVRDYPPFRIAGNLYYVGSYDLGCYLITTPKGHILVNTGIPGSDTLLRRHVEALGFKFSDIRILLTNQVHFDHVGSLAAIRKSTGARVMVDYKDAAVLADGGNSDYTMGGKGLLFLPVKADRLLHDGDTITLGGMRIRVLHHPGHTKGSCSFLFDVSDEKRRYRVLIANMPSILGDTKFPDMPTYKGVERDYAYTLGAMQGLSFDIWVAAHASQFDLHTKHAPGDGYRPEEFFDRGGYDEEIGELRKAYLKRVRGMGGR